MKKITSYLHKDGLVRKILFFSALFITLCVMGCNMNEYSENELVNPIIEHFKKENAQMLYVWLDDDENCGEALLLFGDGVAFYKSAKNEDGNIAEKIYVKGDWKEDYTVDTNEPYLLISFLGTEYGMLFKMDWKKNKETIEWSAEKTFNRV